MVNIGLFFYEGVSAISSFLFEKAKNIQELYPLNPHQGSTMSHCGASSTLRNPLEFHNNFVVIFHEIKHLKTQSLLKNKH